MKKVILFIITAMCIVALCACGKGEKKEEVKQNSKSEDKLLYLKMQINIDEATLYLSEANEAAINSLKALKANNEESSIYFFKEALNLLSFVRTRVDDSISNPNVISTGLEELERNYKETISFLSRLSDLSEEENDSFNNLMRDGTSKHIFLLKTLYAFTNLYKIREFDKLPEAERNLQDNWWKFGFKEEVKCPKSIDVQELYLIWANQFFENVNEDEFLEKLNDLRETDNLSSQDSNKKWTGFIESLMSQEKGRSS